MDPENPEISAGELPLKKTKRTMTPEQLEHLARIRAKAAEKRRALGALTAKEKALKAMEMAAREREIEAKMQGLTVTPSAPAPGPPPAVAPPAPSAKKPLIYVDSSTSSSDSDEDARDLILVKKKTLKRLKKKGSAPAAPPLNARDAAYGVAANHLHSTLDRQVLKSAWESLFPGAAFQ
jgi:hypothetical protein